jgi:hypothetical protein
MAAFTFVIGDDTRTSFNGYSNYTFRSSYVPSTDEINVNGAINSNTPATNRPILVTLFRLVFPTNSGTSARLELDNSSTGTATYASSYRNCSGTQEVVPNYRMNAGATIWYGFRQNTTATLDYFSGATGEGVSDRIVRDANGTVSTLATDRSLYARLSWYGVPAAPSSLTASAVTSSSVTLSWTKNSDMGGYDALTGYRVLYKATSDSTWLSTGKIGGDATTQHTISGLTPGVSYDFRVAATNAATDVYNPDYSLSSATVGTNASVTASTLVGGIRNDAGFWVAPGVRVWNGSSWAAGAINVWTGTEWRRQ